MNEPIELYVTVVIVGLMLTVLVGMILYRNGEPFLVEVFGDRDKAMGINRLLVVLFHLVMLGILAVISVIEVPWAESATQIVLTKLGVVLLVLGAGHGTTMLVLSRIRTRRRLPKLRREVTVQPAEQAPHQVGGSRYDAPPGR